MSAYRAAIERTSETVVSRARLFRNHVVAVVVLCLVTAIWAAFRREPVVLACVFFLVPLGGSFFLADELAVERWRADLLASWVRRELDLAALRAALIANPALPRQTLSGMLATLPSSELLESEQRLSTSTRAAVASVSREIHRRNLSLMGVRVAASAIAVSGIVAAIALSSMIALLACGASVLLPVAQGYIRRRYVGRRDAVLADCSGMIEFVREDGVRLIGALE